MRFQLSGIRIDYVQKTIVVLIIFVTLLAVLRTPFDTGQNGETWLFGKYSFFVRF